jgi:hypothetical protein
VINRSTTSSVRTFVSATARNPYRSGNGSIASQHHSRKDDHVARQCVWTSSVKPPTNLPAARRPAPRWRGSLAAWTAATSRPSRPARSRGG